MELWLPSGRTSVASITPYMFRSIALAGALLAAPALADDPPSNQELYDLYQAQQEQIDATADALDADDGKGSAGWVAKTRLGGYGEVHLNFLEGSSGADNVSEADFHRFVLFINHDFSNKIRLFTEIELEHAVSGGGGPGEVELEQAYIEFDLPLDFKAVGGLFLAGDWIETGLPSTIESAVSSGHRSAEAAYQALETRCVADAGV